ncbi:mitochondrial amino-acid acetyltransferase [Xylogone sp. PMI_703]|nr:mitochondrial amino-acid acetyltransferase [Xylogone sp. PMI_703]
MVLQNMALKRGKGKACRNVQSWVQCLQHHETLHGNRNHYSTSQPLLKNQLNRSALTVPKKASNSEGQNAKKIDRDFFLSVLGSSATKRDARSYLQRFDIPKEQKRATLQPKSEPSSAENQKHESYASGVNLGTFYGQTRALEESPKFIQHPVKESKYSPEPHLHIALVKLRGAQHMDDDTLNGIGKILTQLRRLGLLSVVVIDCSETPEHISQGASDSHWRNLAREQATRLVAAIDANGKPGARVLDSIIAVSETDQAVNTPTHFDSGAHVTLRDLLLTPLKRGLIPVIPPVGYSDKGLTAVPLRASDVVLALAKELLGFQVPSDPYEDPSSLKNRIESLKNEVSVDRLIILDPLGGIPAIDRLNGYHVFLNMEQEYETVRQELLSSNKCEPDHKGSDADGAIAQPLSEFVEDAANGLQLGHRPKSMLLTTEDVHLDNIDLVRKVLMMLPRTSSALLTTAEEVAKSAMPADTPFQAAGVGTRRHRNLLIHNLLTDKPVFSSSLPVGRLGMVANRGDTWTPPTARVTPTTFAKHGMPLTIFPDPFISPWNPPEIGKPALNLTDPQIDLPRLVYLIEDSFGRKLDVKDYLTRVEGRIAGIIIAGEYEGAAILTWEVPPGIVDDGSPESRARMAPYLDKFAVLKRSQGSAGVADVLFTAMVRSCFPGGVMWRSRKDNPVNKWYFERSNGTWKIPDTNWTMFWTTPDWALDKQTFLDYEGICRGIAPSWADNKSIVD